MKKLNWGCGSIQPEGWENVDHDSIFQAKKTTRFYKDDTFDIIVAHASIQQVKWHDLVEQLMELRRILKPGGVLRISLPDFIVGFQAYRDGDPMGFLPNSEPDLDDRFSAWLTWYSTTRTLLTQKALLNKLMEAGFKEAGQAFFKQNWYGLENTIEAASRYKCDEALELDTRPKEFFFMEARK